MSTAWNARISIVAITILTCLTPQTAVAQWLNLPNGQQFPGGEGSASKIRDDGTKLTSSAILASDSRNPFAGSTATLELVMQQSGWGPAQNWQIVPTVAGSGLPVMNLTAYYAVALKPSGGVNITLDYSHMPELDPSWPSLSEVHWINIVHTNYPMPLVPAHRKYYDPLDGSIWFLDGFSPTISPFYDYGGAASGFHFEDAPRTPASAEEARYAHFTTYLATITGEPQPPYSSPGVINVSSQYVNWGFGVVIGPGDGSEGSPMASVPEPNSVLLFSFAISSFLLLRLSRKQFQRERTIRRLGHTDVEDLLR